MVKICIALRTYLLRVTQWLCIISASGMSVLVTLQILFRFFHTGYGWTDELSRYFMVWMAMFGASLMVAENADVRLEFVVKRLPAKIARVLEAINNLLIFVFLCILCYYGFIKAFSARNFFATSIRISMLWFYLSVPIGALLMLIQLFCRIVTDHAYENQKDRKEEPA